MSTYFLPFRFAFSAALPLGVLLALLGCTEDPAPSADSDAAVIDAALMDVSATSRDTEAPAADATLGQPDAAGSDTSVHDSTTPPDGAVAGPGCPPQGPFGTNVGSVVPNATVMDCDGNDVTLHSLCDGDAVWISMFADWCPPCRSFARDNMETVWQSHRDRINGLVIVTANMSYGSPTQELCAEIRDRYELTIPIAFDPTGAAAAALGLSDNAENMVLRRGMEVAWTAKYAEHMVSAQISAVLDE